MKTAANKIILSLFVTLCACSDTRAGKSCAQPYQQMAYAENRTAQPLTIQFSYLDASDVNQRKTVSASIPAGGTFAQKLRDYTVEKSGSSGMSGPKNAYCSSTPERSVANLSLAADTFGQLKNCQVGDGSGLVYLLDNSATCPGFTTQQGTPL